MRCLPSYLLFFVEGKENWTPSSPARAAPSNSRVSRASNGAGREAPRAFISRCHLSPLPVKRSRSPRWRSIPQTEPYCRGEGALLQRDPAGDEPRCLVASDLALLSLANSPGGTFPPTEGPRVRRHAPLTSESLLIIALHLRGRDGSVRSACSRNLDHRAVRQRGAPELFKPSALGGRHSRGVNHKRQRWARPQRGHASTSTPNVRRINSAHWYPPAREGFAQAAASSVSTESARFEPTPSCNATGTTAARHAGPAHHSIYGTRIWLALEGDADRAAQVAREACDLVQGPVETCPGCRITLAVPAAIAAARAGDLERLDALMPACEFLATTVMHLPGWYAALDEVRAHGCPARGDRDGAARHFAAAASRFAAAGEPLDAVRCERWRGTMMSSARSTASPGHVGCDRVMHGAGTRSATR